MSSTLWTSLQSRLQPPYHQDGPWSWVVLLCAAFHALMSHGFNRAFAVFLPVLVEEFNESRGKVALIGSLATGTLLLMSAVTSLICTRLDVRVVCGIGHVIRCVSLLITPLMYTIVPMYFTYSLSFGVGGSFMFIPGMFSLVKYFKKRRSFAMGVIMAGSGLGVMTMPPLSQYFIDTLGWRNAWRLLACFYVASCFLALAYQPDVVENNEGEQEKDQHGSTPSGEKKSREKEKGKLIDCSIWKLSQFKIAVLSVCLASFGLYNAPNHLVKFAGEIGIPASKASILYTFMGGASVASRLITGRLCECVKATYINIGCQVLSAVCVFLLPQASTYTHLISYSVVSGVLDGAFRTTMAILFSESGGSRDKAAIAYSQGVTATSIFQAGGPAIAGVMADKSGNYTSAFYMSSAVLAAGSAVQLVPLFLKLCNKGTTQEETRKAVEIELGSSYGDSNEEKDSKTTHDQRNEPEKRSEENIVYEVTRL